MPNGLNQISRKAASAVWDIATLSVRHEQQLDQELLLQSVYSLDLRVMRDLGMRPAEKRS